MRFSYHKGIFFALALCASCLNARQVDGSTLPRASIPETEIRYVRSSIIGDEFEISVALPRTYRSTDTTYPVLYFTDANMLFAAATQIVRLLQFPGPDALPQILLIGIGYRTESVAKWNDLRRRDLLPASDPTIRQQAGAALFLRFIREELMPLIRKNYRTSPDAGFAGGSLGGLFALYTLFHEPETFQRYIIISPSIQYDNRVTFKYEAEYARGHSDLPARVFMSVGGLEQHTDSSAGMITNMRQLADRLRTRRYPNLRLETVVFDAETHRSGIAAAISRGARVIYRK